MKDILFIIAQIIGALVFVIKIVGYTKITTRQVYIYNGVCNALAAIQYTLLGALTGALCCLIALLRNIVFSRFKNKIPVYILLIYIGLVIVLNITLINGALDILPMINIILYAYGLWTKDIMTIKIMGLFTCFTGAIYDYNSRAYVTVLNEIIDGIIAVRCIYILKKKKGK